MVKERTLVIYVQLLCQIKTKDLSYEYTFLLLGHFKNNSPKENLYLVLIVRVGQNLGTNHWTIGFSRTPKTGPYLCHIHGHLVACLRQSSPFGPVLGQLLKVCVLSGSVVQDYLQSPGSMIKSLPAEQETWVPSLGWEEPLEKEMAIHSSILVWEIPWTEETGGLQATGSQSQTRLSGNAR